MVGVKLLNVELPWSASGWNCSGSFPDPISLALKRTGFATKKINKPSTDLMRK